MCSSRKRAGCAVRKERDDIWRRKEKEEVGEGVKRGVSVADRNGGGLAFNGARAVCLEIRTPRNPRGRHLGPGLAFQRGIGHWPPLTKDAVPTDRPGTYRRPETISVT